MYWWAHKLHMPQVTVGVFTRQTDYFRSSKVVNYLGVHKLCEIQNTHLVHPKQKVTQPSTTNLTNFACKIHFLFTESSEKLPEVEGRDRETQKSPLLASDFPFLTH